MLTRFLSVLILVAAFPAAAHSATFAFKAPINVKTPAMNSRLPSDVVIADFNGDGRDDLAAMGLDYFEVFLQNDGGTLSAPLAPEPPFGVFLGAIHGADLDGDGARELLVGHQKGLAIYRSDGAGGFTLDDRRTEYACWNIASADLDGDGAPDVLCLGLYADAMLFYSDAGTGLGVPTYMQTAAMQAGTLGQAQLKDVTGDGKPDLLLASGSANSFFVYRHDGDRGFLPAVAYPYPEAAYLWSHTIEALDLDGDGGNEVVVAAPCNMPCSTLYVYRHGNQPYLELAQSVPTLDNPDALLATDVDADLDEDLLVGHRGWSTVGRYLTQGQGLPSAELWSSVPVRQLSRGLASGDLNRDGHADLAVANSFGVSLLYGGLLAANDFGSDFQSDLVWRNPLTGENKVWMSADSAKSQGLPARDQEWTVQAIADFDGDGEADMFWRNRKTGANEILSAGLSQVNDTLDVASQDWQVVGAGDFDGDGRADLLWRNARSGANAIWKSGVATSQQATATVSDLRWKVAGVGDFDGDRRADILWRHSASGSNAIWRSGRSEAAQAVAAASPQWTVAGAGDFDGDRKDDVVWRNTSTGTNTIWLSADSAAPIAVSTVADMDWVIAAAGDYNGDERADLMWRNLRTGANVIWRSADSRRSQAVTSMPGWNVVP